MTPEQLREELPVTRELAYFQTGSWGPTPDSVLKILYETMRYESQHGPGSQAVRETLQEKEHHARVQLAALLHVRPQELGFTTNTSQAIERVFRSFSWGEGDEIVLSSHEHVSTIAACQTLLEKGMVVVIRTVDATTDDASFLNHLQSTLSARTKLVCLSHVTSADGRRLPVAEAVRIARGMGVPVLVDGAQAVGQFPVDVSSLGCDFYAAAGTKWLLGPMGLGFLWVSPTRLPLFKPDLLPDVHPWAPLGVPFTEVTTSTRIEGIETRNFALPIALERAVEILTSLGLDTVQAHVSRLSSMLRGELTRWSRAQVLTPITFERSSGITTVAFEGYGEREIRRLVAGLYGEDNIVVKLQWLTAPARSDRTAIRISVAVFNTEAEVNRLLSALKRGGCPGIS